MEHMEQLDLLKAALAVAMADGVLTRSEKGVIEGLAKRVGIGKASLEAMLEASAQDQSIADYIFIKEKAHAHNAFELLVAQAGIDGDISESERELLIRIAASLNISEEDFSLVYHAGLTRADALRKARE